MESDIHFLSKMYSVYEKQSQNLESLLRFPDSHYLENVLYELLTMNMQDKPNEHHVAQNFP